MSKFITTEKVTTLTQALKAIMDAKDAAVITSTLDATSTNDKAAGAKAVYDLVTANATGGGVDLTQYWSKPELTEATDEEVQAAIDAAV